MVRPPYKIDRLVVVEIKDSSTLGIVYLSEWKVASAAFTLQSSDPKTFRTMVEAIRRAQDLYTEAQQSRDVSVYDRDEEIMAGYLAPRSPRPGSSRASRVSSLAHSHSGSVDLNEAPYTSPGAHHPPSFDLSDVRASSASSEDSGTHPPSEIQRSRSLEGQQPGMSPRVDRRTAHSKTPNTLSVVPPCPTGQSLPNLTSETTGNSLLKVPNHKSLSASNRGISYPPPSPRTLRRSAPVPQSRNPPLIKTRHVVSTVGVPQNMESSTIEYEPLRSDGEDEPGRPGQRRNCRNDRLDNRRYHTAGAIDDIKVSDFKKPKLIL